MKLLPVVGFLSAMTTCVVGVGTPTPAAGGVTLLVVVNPVLFAPNATLSVDVWNASQLSALDDNARCSAVSGPNGTSQVVCPPGVTYKNVVAEHMEFPLGSGSGPIEVVPKQVEPGERFRIRLSGPNRDRCNATSADLIRTAQSGRTDLGEPAWQTTLRGCLTPPQGI